VFLRCFLGDFEVIWGVLRVKSAILGVIEVILR
jgi:hypothetical protein